MQPLYSPLLKARSFLRSRRTIAIAVAVPLLIGGIGVGAVEAGSRRGGQDPNPTETLTLEVRSLDGSGNNTADPSLGQSGTIYPRVAAANYADGLGEPIARPAERYVSNRIFNDTNQNRFSENNVTHWGFVWGQFIDHTIGLREEASAEAIDIAFDPDDPLEEFTNDLGAISTTRSAIADGSGVDSPREQVNTVSSYIDGFAIYGGSDDRLDWLREGPIDGDPTNNYATLLSVDGFLPTGAARPDAETPTVELQGRLFANPADAVIAGDVRANENLGLTATHTLFLREHNRIVEQLPEEMDEETKFQIARRVVSGLQQYITYEEFLPAMGVDVGDYNGYDAAVDPSITNEFASVGYRAHSAVHGEFEAELPLEDFTEEELAAIEAQGIEVEVGEEAIEVAIPLNIAFGNPRLLPQLGLGHMLAGFSSEAAYFNDEQIDNQLRSVLFQVPGPDVENPLDCLDGTEIADCFTGVNDLGALDLARAADHGMPTYNDLREAYGLPRVTSFTEITGEETEEFPEDAEIDAENPIDDPNILDVLALADINGEPLEIGSEEGDGESVTVLRRTTAAARLKAIYGSVDEVEAFAGMVSEGHVEGAEFGELQLEIWRQQFAALRDGDRFFYDNDPMLEEIAEECGIDYQRTLAEVIAANSETDPAALRTNVFAVDSAIGVDLGDDDAEVSQQRGQADCMSMTLG